MTPKQQITDDIQASLSAEEKQKAKAVEELQKLEVSNKTNGGSVLMNGKQIEDWLNKTLESVVESKHMDK